MKITFGNPGERGTIDISAFTGIQMRITTKEFETAIEVAYRRGICDCLPNLMTPAEVKARLHTVTLAAYAIINQDKNVPPKRRNDP